MNVDIILFYLEG